MRARLASVALVLALGACGGDDEAIAAAHPRGPAGAPAPTTASAAPELVRAHHTFDTLDREDIQHATAPSAAGASGAGAGGGAGSAPAATTARNYAAELATAIGSPAPCIDLAEARSIGAHLSVAVSAMVTPAGNVTRASVMAGVLSLAALACIE